MSLHESLVPSDQSTVELRSVIPTQEQPKRSHLKLACVAGGLFLALLNLLVVVTVLEKPAKDWIELLLAGVITGFALGTVFGIWTAKSIGYDPSPKKFLLAAVVVVLNACVGFFGYPWVTGHGFWPDQNTFFYSLSTASILVSAAMFCLVNFVWHSRDQKRIHTLRGVLNKKRLELIDAQTRISEAQREAQTSKQSTDEIVTRVAAEKKEAEEARRAAEVVLQQAEVVKQESEKKLDEARRQVDLHRKMAHEAFAKAEEERKRAEEERASAMDAQRHAADAKRELERLSAQIQEDGEKERRRQLALALLAGQWRCDEFMARPEGAEHGLEGKRQKEQPPNRDLFLFRDDGGFVLTHPGIETSLVDSIAHVFTGERSESTNTPFQRYGNWSLDATGDCITIHFTDGKKESHKIRILTKTHLALSSSIKAWDRIRFLVRNSGAVTGKNAGN